jgi:hypothetical protein
MENNVTQENVVPEKSEKQKSLEDIVALGETISVWRSAVKTVAISVVIACLAYIGADIAGFTSPFIFPALMLATVGNQVYIFRTDRKQKKLDEMKKTYESKFGAVSSAN